jgi:hypothetical protein
MNDDKKYPYYRQLNSLDFGQLGFTSYQINDLRILLSLETLEQTREWADAVGPEDQQYGSTLLQLLALGLIDQAVEQDDDCAQANAVLAQFMPK